MKFSVIIVAYKEIDILVNCLDSISQFNDIGKALEIIVVDNSPDNELFNFIKEKYQDVIIKKNTNTGFGDGNNQGANLARGEYVLFLNPDTRLIEPIFEFAIKKFDNHPEVGLFGVKLLDSELNNNLSFYFMEDKGVVGNQMLKLMNKLNLFIPKTMFISGANMFMRMDEFNKIGRFDSNIFMYMEERDITFRLIQHGMTNAFYKEKKIVHLEGQTTKNSEDIIRRKLVTQKYFCSKYNINQRVFFKKKIKYLKNKKIIFSLLKKNTNLIDSELNLFLEYFKTIN